MSNQVFSNSQNVYKIIKGEIIDLNLTAVFNQPSGNFEFIPYVELFNNIDGIDYTSPGVITNNRNGNVNLLINMTSEWATNNTGTREQTFVKGIILYGLVKVDFINGGTEIINSSGIIQLAPGDTIGLKSKQTTAGNLDMVQDHSRCQITVI